MGKERPNLSMRIDSEIKENFKEETYRQGIPMTEAVEKLMVSFINASRKQRNGEEA